MRRAALIFLGLLAMAYNAPVSARSLIVTSQDHSLVDADDCAHFHTQNTTSLPSVARSEEQRKLSLSGVLKVRTLNEGGVSVKGWDRPYASLTVCKSAVALSDTLARTALANINVAVGPGGIIASGPGLNETQTWWVHMILRVPRKASLDVGAANGGISIRNMSGNVTARATNGGISLASCAGENHIVTENGGITLEKISGSVDASTRNGPIALKLRDVAVPTIDAHTENSGEIFCRVRGCDELTPANFPSDRRHLRMGSASPMIRLSTIGADIMIEQVR